MSNVATRGQCNPRLDCGKDKILSTLRNSLYKINNSARHMLK